MHCCPHHSPQCPESHYRNHPDPAELQPVFCNLVIGRATMNPLPLAFNGFEMQTIRPVWMSFPHLPEQDWIAAEAAHAVVELGKSAQVCLSKVYTSMRWMRSSIIGKAGCCHSISAHLLLPLACLPTMSRTARGPDHFAVPSSSWLCAFLSLKPICILTAHQFWPSTTETLAASFYCTVSV